jgi:hypothetical protein
VSDGVAGQGSPFARMLLDTLRSYGGESGIVTTANIFSAAQVLKTQPAWGELPNHSPGGQFVFAVGGGGNVVRPRPLSALERERPLIQSALDSFAAAYKQRNVQALALVYPTLPEAERRALQRAFASDCREYSVTLATPEMFLTNGEGRPGHRGCDLHLRPRQRTEAASRPYPGCLSDAETGRHVGDRGSDVHEQTAIAETSRARHHVFRSRITPRETRKI